MRLRRPWIAVTFATAVLLLTLAPAGADVRDEASFFSAQTERQISERIQKIRQEHGKDVAVETVRTLSDAPEPGEARQEFLAREVARRGKDAGVDGVYILVSRNPSTLYVGIDPQTQRGAFTPRDRDRVRDHLVDRFKAEDFDGGIVAALQMIDQRLAANASGSGNPGAAGAAGSRGAATPGGAAAERPGATGDSADDGGASPSGSPSGGVCGMGGMGGIGGWLCLIIAGLAIFTIVRGLARRRQMAAGAGFPVQPGGGQPGMGQPGMGQPGMGQPGMGQPGMGQPGYGQPGYGGGGGGGMGTGILGGLLGGVAGGYLYDKMSGPGGNEAQAATPPDSNTLPAEDPGTTSGYGDFGDAGGDAGGGGGDFGGGDFGGGDSGGGGDF